MARKESKLEIRVLKIVSKANPPYVILETNLGEIYSLREGDVLSFTCEVTLE